MARIRKGNTTNLEKAFTNASYEVTYMGIETKKSAFGYQYQLAHFQYENLRNGRIYSQGIDKSTVELWIKKFRKAGHPSAVRKLEAARDAFTM